MTPLVHLPVWQVTQEDVEQAFSNRKAVAVGSAAGPSALGKALSFVAPPNPDARESQSFKKGAAAGWTREGESTIRKRSTEAEALFYKAIGASGNLAHHIPVTYSIGAADCQNADGSDAYDIVMQAGQRRPSPPPLPRHLLPQPPLTRAADSAVPSVCTQDLVSGMTRPCAMALILGTRTVTAAELTSEEASTVCIRLLLLPCCRLVASGCFWLSLVASGCFWLLLVASGCF